MRPIVCCFGWLVLLGCLMVGCEGPEVTPPAPATAPATAPTDPADPGAAPTTDPAATAQARASHMLIDQRRIEFPPAKLVLRVRGSQVHGLLYSDDPPDALDDRYTGNSFYFDLPLEMTDVQELDATRWIFKAPHSERADTVSGIYLQGRRRHLQPFDVVVEFERHSGGVKVWLSGQFLLFEANDDPTIPGQLVPVAAALDADLTVKSR